MNKMSIFKRLLIKSFTCPQFLVWDDGQRLDCGVETLRYTGQRKTPTSAQTSETKCSEVCLVRGKNQKVNLWHPILNTNL